ncbi:MAG: hypothetical protein ACRER5_16390 [Pseudomonas sp.]
MKRGFALLALMTLTACVSSPSIRFARPADFALVMVDNPAQKRFDLTLTSKGTESLCLSTEAWPGLASLPMGFDGATLVTSSGANELLPTGSAYCPGGCGEVRVASGLSVHGILRYSAFGDESAIAKDSMRVLSFEVHPYICSK